MSSPCRIDTEFTRKLSPLRLYTLESIGKYEMDKWKYYGRTLGTGVFEVFRFPDNGLDLDDQDYEKYPERLQPDGSWVCFPDDMSFWDDQISGYFIEDDNELSREQVDELYALWSQGPWPGPRRKI